MKRSTTMRSGRRGRKGKFVVVAKARNLKPLDLPMSARLEAALQRKRVARLGKLRGMSLSDFESLPNCGRKTLDELLGLLGRTAAGEFDVGKPGFSPANCARLLQRLDEACLKLLPRDMDILRLRLGGEGGRALTLEAIGSRFKLTRERIRQVEERTTNLIRRESGPKLTCLLEGLRSRCLDSVCPLTPDLLLCWLGKSPRELILPAPAYVRLMSELNPRLPAWPNGQEPSGLRKGFPARLGAALREILLAAPEGVPLKAALEFARSRPGMSRVGAADFLAALKHSSTIRVEFADPEAPAARLQKLRFADAAMAVLTASPSALTREEILARVQTQFGANRPSWGRGVVSHALKAERGFYLLGPRSYGLRRHFRLDEGLWKQVRDDVRGLLEEAKHPLSTPGIVDEHRFEWTRQTDKYELAEILRDDKRFADLGRHLFGLARWKIAEREFIKDLVPRILSEAGRPLTPKQILERVRCARSVSSHSISRVIRSTPEVHDYGFSRYGLRAWGDAARASLVSDPAFVEQAIRRCEPPLSFGRLCEILKTPPESELAERLWQTATALGNVNLVPAERASNTLVIHKSHAPAPTVGGGNAALPGEAG